MKQLSNIATPQEQDKIRQLVSEPFVLDNDKLKRVSISKNI